MPIISTKGKVNLLIAQEKGLTVTHAKSVTYQDDIYRQHDRWPVVYQAKHKDHYDLNLFDAPTALIENICICSYPDLPYTCTIWYDLEERKFHWRVLTMKESFEFLNNLFKKMKELDPAQWEQCKKQAQQWMPRKKKRQRVKHQHKQFGRPKKTPKTAKKRPPKPKTTPRPSEHDRKLAAFDASVKENIHKSIWELSFDDFFKRVLYEGGFIRTFIEMFDNPFPSMETFASIFEEDGVEPYVYLTVYTFFLRYYERQAIDQEKDVYAVLRTEDGKADLLKFIETDQQNLLLAYRDKGVQLWGAEWLDSLTLSPESELLPFSSIEPEETELNPIEESYESFKQNPDMTWKEIRDLAKELGIPASTLGKKWDEMGKEEFGTTTFGQLRKKLQEEAT